jgi:predicted nucleic acid-binding protein
MIMGPGRTGLLIDSNLLVLYMVGTVNRDRIQKFKRTQRYSESDYALLVDFLGRFRLLFTVAHVMAEVSNLIDLSGQERSLARSILAKTINTMQEPHVSSLQAANEKPFEELGLVDSAIFLVAREQGCTVLTDDVALYLALEAEGLPVVNFTHLREQSWEHL